MMRFVSVLAVAAMVLLSSGCLLSRPDSPAIRYLEPQLVTDPTAMHSATNADPVAVRLAVVTSVEHVSHPLMFERSGELQPSREWQWATRPTVYLARSLGLHAAHQGVALQDDPRVPAVAVQLTAFQLVRTDAERPDDAFTLVAEAAVSRTDDTGAVAHWHVHQSAPVSGPLPGDLAIQAGAVIDALSLAIWQQVAAQP